MVLTMDWPVLRLAMVMRSMPMLLFMVTVTVSDSLVFLVEGVAVATNPAITIIPIIPNATIIQNRVFTVGPPKRVEVQEVVLIREGGA